jgi:hypothetical protein
MTEPVAKWGKLGYEPVRGLQDRIVSRWLRAQRKNMARVFAERGLFHLVERLQQIRKSRQGMVAKNLMFQEVLSTYATQTMQAQTPVPESVGPVHDVCEAASQEMEGATSGKIPISDHGMVSPGESRAWDVDAALVRVAGGNAQAFKGRLRELALAYRAEEDQHLSFNEVQALATASAWDTLSAKQAAHVHDCAFCRNLIDTLVGSNEERDAFLRLVGQHERRAEPDVILERQQQESGISDSDQAIAE